MSGFFSSILRTKFAYQIFLPRDDATFVGAGKVEFEGRLADYMPSFKIADGLHVLLMEPINGLTKLPLVSAFLVGKFPKFGFYLSVGGLGGFQSFHQLNLV